MLLGRLCRAGHVPVGEPGRRQAVAAMEDAGREMMRIGIDWGGTKIEAVALGSDGRELARERIATPRGDYEGCVRAVVRLVTGLEARFQARGTVGIGIPGSISPETGLVKNANSTWLNGRPISGFQRNAGEWGHNPLPWMSAAEFPGPRCWCGKLGCLETFISGTGFERDFAQATGEMLAASETFDANEIVRRMRAGDGAATAAYRRYADRLARGLASVINILDPDLIVLGGGLSNVDELYADLSALLPVHVFSDACRTPVVKARHGDLSGVRGAAWLWEPSRP